MSERGTLVAVEGGDGSGKGTQATRLVDQLVNVYKLPAIKYSFPRYGEPSAKIAENYLNGAYGGANQVHPDLASLPFTLDRVAAASDLRRQLSLGKTAVLDRYVASNMAHQGTKIHARDDRHAFYRRTMELEYDVLGIPKPDINLVLLVPSSVAQRNVDQKGERSYTSLKRDVHEADANHLELAKANYEELCELFPEAFIAIESMSSALTMRSIEDIGADIEAKVIPLIEERQNQGK